MKALALILVFGSLVACSPIKMNDPSLGGGEALGPLPVEEGQGQTKDPIAEEQTPPAPAPGTNLPQKPAFDEKLLTQWYVSTVPRGNEVTRGDTGMNIRRVSNRLPRDYGSETDMVVCAGAGCPIKAVYRFTAGQINELKQIMAEAQKGCQGPECERQALRQATTRMEMMVHDNLLAPMSRTEFFASVVESGGRLGGLGYGQQLDLDCVDQATNVTSYLVVLAKHNLIQHHEIIDPGMENILIFQPHFFGRIRGHNGQIFKFDLYHRGRFGIPPYVTCLNCVL